MYKTWTDVNQYNQGLVLRTVTGNTNYPLLLTNQNYASIYDLATNFANNLKSVLDAYVAPGRSWGTTTTSVTNPPVNTPIGGTTSNVISITITTQNNHGLVANDLINGNFAIQSVIDVANLPGGLALNLGGVADGADSGLLLGCDRVTSSTLTSSFTINITNVKQIVITALYPAQRSTEPNVYVRVNPATQTYCSNTFESVLLVGGENNLVPTSILAEIRVDTEMVQYTPQAERQYFGNFYQQSLSHLMVALTDSRNRPLPLYGTNQATSGNRCFTMTLRVDVVQETAYGEIHVNEEQYVKHTLPPRFDSNVLIHQKVGRPGFGRPAGF
jgi:hypothetical protein